MFNFRNIPIFRRLFIAFAIAAVIPGIIVVLLGQFYLNSLVTRDQAVRTSFDAQNVASQQLDNLQRMNALLQTRCTQIFAGLSAVVKDPSLNATGGLINTDIITREGDFDQTLKDYQSAYALATSDNMMTIRNILLSENPNTGVIKEQQAALNSVIMTGWPTYKKLQDKVLNQLSPYDADLQNGQTPTVSEVNQAYEAIYPTLFATQNAYINLRNDWERVVNATVDMGKTVTAVGPSQSQPIFLATALALILTLMVVILTGWVVNVTITQPLRRLSLLTSHIAKGDMQARSTVVGRDEIAVVSHAMNNMLDNIVHLIQEAQSQRDVLQNQVEKLVSEVSGVGEGDLRIQAEVTADALGVLADSFNYMVEELSSLVVRVKMVSQEVENSTTQTFERMSQLVESEDTQIQQISEAAVEVEHVANYSRQMAERAQSLYLIAREARQTAETGRESVKLTVEGMGRIHSYVQDTAMKVQALGDSSREIDNIVGVISNIAHQTNRLALDAAIQAAMAGENGKGFGAVAADIRRLAERAKDQANMIGRIVRSVREDIGIAAVSMQDTEREASNGAKLAEEAGSSLESIFSVVYRQGQEIETINQMAGRQLQSSNTVVQIMQNVSEATQQSSASTREAAQNMERLARLAEQLLASVEAFKLRENANYYPPTNVTVMPESNADNYMIVNGVFRTITASTQPPQLGRYPTYPKPSLSPGNLPATTSRPGAEPIPAFAPSPYRQHDSNDNGFGNAAHVSNDYNGASSASNGSSQVPARPQQRLPRPPEPPRPTAPPQWQ